MTQEDVKYKWEKKSYNKGKNYRVGFTSHSGLHFNKTAYILDLCGTGFEFRKNICTRCILDAILKATLFFHRFRETWFFHTRSLPFLGTFMPQPKLTQLLDMVPGLEGDSGKHWEPPAQITSMRIADKRLLMHSGSRELFIVNSRLLYVCKCLQINFWKQFGAFSLNLRCLLLQESWLCR